MMRMFPLFLVAAAAAAFAPAPARAAESYDNCTGTISSLPVVITTQGTWCVKANLSTSISSGAAILIEANNVTIDCNDFKVGGLQAGTGTLAYGILASGGIQNPTIRNCGVRGFRIGISFAGGTFGGLLEDNRVDSSTDQGIYVQGGGHVVRRNRVVDTGGNPSGTHSIAITSYADQTAITDNAILGVSVVHANGDVTGIGSYGDACDVARNTVSGLVSNGTGEAIGLSLGAAANSSLRDNHLLNIAEFPGKGIVSGSANLCGGNRIAGYPTGIVGCTDAGGNVAN